MPIPYASLDELTARVVECRLCPRLVEWREAVARFPPPRLCRPGILGQAGARVGRPAGAADDRRAGAWGARLQPHREDVHRGCLGQFSLPRYAPGWVCQPAQRQPPRRRVAVDRCLHERHLPLRPARQ